MQHQIFRVQRFQVIGPFKLRVGFDDGTEQLIDFRPVLAGELFEPLSELSLFNQVAIDPEVHTLVWPNGATSILRRCTIGPCTSMSWRGARKWELQSV